MNIKKSQLMSPDDMFLAVKKAAEAGNRRVMLTERGTFFGYNNLVVDFRSIPRMKESGCPVIMDATHAVQRPSGAGEVSGGDPQFIPHAGGRRHHGRRRRHFSGDPSLSGKSPVRRDQFPAFKRSPPPFNPPAKVV